MYIVHLSFSLCICIKVCVHVQLTFSLSTCINVCIHVHLPSHCVHVSRYVFMYTFLLIVYMYQGMYSYPPYPSIIIVYMYQGMYSCTLYTFHSHCIYVSNFFQIWFYSIEESKSNRLLTTHINLSKSWRFSVVFCKYLLSGSKVSKCFIIFYYKQIFIRLSMPNFDPDRRYMRKTTL